MDWSEDFYTMGQVLLAGCLGAVLGIEREISDKPAGLRTHIFVCAASALLMFLGNHVLERFAEEGHRTIQADPIRIMQAIVIGISFLGAGTIIHEGGNRVEGLTTAASVFLTAGIGIAVAVERVYLAVGTTLFGVVVLLFIGRIERWADRFRQRSKKGDAGKGDKSAR